MKIRMRLHEVDRQTYGGPEWSELHLDQLAEVDSGLLEEFEETIGLTVVGEFPEQLQRRALKAIRAALWLSRRLSGHKDDWTTFKPNLLKVDFELVDEDDPGKADPPSGS